MPFHPRRAGVLAVAAVLVIACNPSASVEPSGLPSPGPTVTPPSPSPGAVSYAQIRRDVVDIRGLRATADVDPVTIDEVRLRENLEAELDAEVSAEELATAEDILAVLGLIPTGSSLRELTLDLQAGQVAGYYSPNRDELFVVSRSGAELGPVERVTYAHEFTHQLQDQNFDLDSLGLDAPDQSDRTLAVLAVVEGDARWVQAAWMAANLTPQELGELLAASLDPEAIEALRNAPAYLRETALFPYEDGLALVQRLIGEGGYEAVDAAFGDPPESTEQVLHPDRYIDREAPITVRIDDVIAARVGSGWSDGGRDTLGELILDIWLREHGVTSQVARAATAGWGGDRLVLLRGPDGALGIGLATTWDTDADAAEFAAAAASALTDAGFEGLLFHRAGTRDVLVAIGEQAQEILAALRG